MVRRMETARSVRDAFDLTGRVALVTGAGSGIGRTTAEVLAGAGATVVCADIDADGAAVTAREIVGEGGKAESAELNVAARGAADMLVGHITARHGALHVLCNIAGIMIDSAIVEVDPDEFDRILAVNLKGVLYGCQAAGKVMVRQGGGSIINMASAAVLTPTPGVGPYAITKAGVAQLTQSMAAEVGKDGVRVNAVAPGFVPTNMTARYYRRPDGTIDEAAQAAVIGPMARYSPLRRVGTTADIGYCVLYLASDASSFLTGQLLSPNGGVSMHY
jgi:3-oxoacyl-[acyl-carrier protein] reductase